MRILFLTQWFDPEPAFKGSAFVHALRDAGFDVEVATGFPNYPGGKIYSGHAIRLYKRDHSFEFPVHRLYLWPSHDGNALGRSLNYLSFFLSSLLFGLFSGRRFDAVYVYHPPITPGVAAALFTRIHKIPFLVEIQDLWPDSVAASGMSNRRISGILGGLCQFVYRSAAVVIAQSDGMRKLLLERGVAAQKLQRLYNWSTYQPDQSRNQTNAPIENWDSAAVNFVYGGNFGQAQALEAVVRAFAIAQSGNSAIHLHLFGSGIEREAIESEIKSHSTGRIFCHEAVDRMAMDRIFERSDVLVMHLKDLPLYSVTIPSKLQHYLSVGKPVLAGIAGEAADLLDRSGCALVSRPEDVTRMADNIARLAKMSADERRALGRNGVRFYQEHLSMDHAIHQTAALLKKTVDGSIAIARQS